MAEKQLCSCNLRLNNKTVTCGTKTTLYSAAVASSATVRLAFYCGLDIFTQVYDDNEFLHVVAGLHADAETLAVLHDRGMEFSDMLLKAVALSGRFCLTVLDQRAPVPDTQFDQPLCCSQRQHQHAQLAES
jgi:hypothetical protein